MIQNTGPLPPLAREGGGAIPEVDCNSDETFWGRRAPPCVLAVIFGLLLCPPCLFPLSSLLPSPSNFFTPLRSRALASSPSPEKNFEVLHAPLSKNILPKCKIPIFQKVD